jgi:hypothetical protein
VLQERPEPCHAGNEWQASSPLAVPFRRQTYPSELLQRLRSFPPPFVASFPFQLPPKARPDDSTHSGSAMIAQMVNSAHSDEPRMLVWDGQTAALACLLADGRPRIFATACQTTDSLRCCSQTHFLLHSSSPPRTRNTTQPKPVCTKESAASSNFRHGRWRCWKLSYNVRRHRRQLLLWALDCGGRRACISSQKCSGPPWLILILAAGLPYDRQKRPRNTTEIG